jgi:hypothetical protein
VCATKPDLTHRMLDRAPDTGVPASWVTADEVCGGNPATQQAANRRRTPYNKAAPTDTQQHQTPSSEPLSQHHCCSQSGRTCFHTTEVMQRGS